MQITLKAARINAGLTQNDVAHMLHKTTQTVVNWESGATAIKYTDLLALLRVYKMPLEFVKVPK